MDLRFSSDLAAPAAEVWAVASTMPGVNAELGPWLRMTHPPTMSSLAGHDVVPGEVAFRSWLLLGGLVPIDRHALALVRVLDDGPYGFDEESTSWLQARWRHVRRIVERDDGGCTVTDELTVEPRLGLLRPVVRSVAAATFAHRHRRLRARFDRAS